MKKEIKGRNNETELAFAATMLLTNILIVAIIFVIVLAVAGLMQNAGRLQDFSVLLGPVK